MKPDDMPDLTLYMVVNFQEGKGAGEQHVLASSVESAIELFRKGNPGAHIESVLVGDRVLYYGDGNEANQP